MSGTAHFGMVGLGTMGRNFLLNVAEHGYRVVGLDTDPAKAAALNEAGSAWDAKGFTSATEFVAALARPRNVMILVPAGAAVDSVIATLSPLLEARDFLIDGGNSYFRDTDRRSTELASKSLGFLGIGVSGGEEGARHGPSMMAGGDPESYAHVQTVLESVAAVAAGQPCVKRLGPGSAGHYVKMVHNGIEYGLMQLIAESYDLMKRGFGMSNAEVSDVFMKWSSGPLGGFLTDLAGEVLLKEDDLAPGDLVDVVKDQAKQKGTGKWTSQEAMDVGVPIPTIDAAVSARELSALRAERVSAALLLPRTDAATRSKELLDSLASAYELAALSTYAQGFSLLQAASTEHGYGFVLSDCASVWRAGCIIRSTLLGPIADAYSEEPGLRNLLTAPEFRPWLAKLSDLRRVGTVAVESGIPLPAMLASLAYIEGYFTARLAANLIQAQRDSFGAHTYERLDRDGTFHSDWTTK